MVTRLIPITEPFNFTLEINDKQKGSRTVTIVSSTITWDQLRLQIAEHLNVFPSTLVVQYRLSTEAKGSLPCDLASQVQLDVVISILRPLIVPAILANGQRSKRARKAVVVQVFSKNDGSSASSTRKVSKIPPFGSYQF
jgi:hypothetical protein